MFSLILMMPMITPDVKSLTCDDSIYQVGVMQLECAYSNGAACSPHIQDNFDFFAQIAYSRAAPVAADEGSVLTRVVLVIEQESEAYDIINRMPEKYSVKVEADAIQIKAQTGFAASRAFATMV